MMQRKSQYWLDASTRNSASDRDELEDRFFRLKEEHVLLKKQANDAGQTVKVLSTKLSRLINEKKKLVENSKTKKEVQMEEIIYDLQDNIDRLEKENSKLRNQSLLLRTQIDSSANRKRSSSAYSSVRSRIDSGLSNFRVSSASVPHKRASSARMVNRTTFAHITTTKVTNSALLDSKALKPNVYSFNLLREAQSEIKKLEEIIVMQQNIIESLFLHSDSDSSHSFKEVNSLSIVEANTKQVPNSVTHNPQAVDETLVKESALQKPSALPQNATAMSKANEDMYVYIESIRNELLQEKSRSADLQRQLSENVTVTKFDELKQKIKALEEENNVLRQSLENCIGTSLSEINLREKNEKQESNEDVHSECQKMMKIMKERIKKLQTEKETLSETLKCEEQKMVRLREENSKVKVMLQQSRDECNREDHSKLTQQVKHLHSEREHLLAEFSEMKRLLAIIQNNMEADVANVGSS